MFHNAAPLYAVSPRPVSITKDDRSAVRYYVQSIIICNYTTPSITCKPAP